MDPEQLIMLALTGIAGDDAVGDGVFFTVSDPEITAKGYAKFYVWHPDTGMALRFDKATARRIRDRIDAALAEPFDPARN